MLVKTGHEARAIMYLSYILSTSQSTCSGFVPSLANRAEIEGSFEERFQKRCDSSLLFMINANGCFIP